jgi:hypothetical protein
MLPSRALRKVGKEMVGDADYLTGVQKNLKIANNVRDGMDSHFGAAVIAALENLERAAYATMANTNPYFRKGKIAQAQAELKTAKYLKAILISYVSNIDTLEEQIQELYGNEI